MFKFCKNKKILKIDDINITINDLEPMYLDIEFPSKYYSLPIKERERIKWNFLLENVEKIEKEFNIKIYTYKYGYYITK